MGAPLVTRSNGDIINCGDHNDIMPYIENGTYRANTLSLMVGGTEVISSARIIGNITNATITQTTVTGVGLTVSRDLASATTAAPLVFIEQDNAGDDQNALNIQQDGTGRGIRIAQYGDGSGLTVWDTNSAQATDLVSISMDSATSTGNVVDIQNDGTGHGLYIDQNGNGRSLNIDSESTTSNVLQIQTQTTSGGDVYLKSEGLLTGLGIYYNQTHASSTGTCVKITNAGTGNAFYIDQNGDGKAIEIDSEATTSSLIYAVKIDTNTGACFTGTDASTTTYSALVKGKTSANGSNHFFRNLASANTAGPVVFIEQDHTGDDQNAETIQNDGTGVGLLIDQNGANAALRADGQIYSTHQNQGTKTAAYTVNWNNGNCQTVTAGGNFTLSFSNGKTGGSYTLILKQDATGSRTVTLPTVTWNDGDTAPTLSTGASDVDIMSFIYDGSVYYGSYSLDHS